MDISSTLTHTVLGRPERTADDLALLFHPSYVQVTDGVVSDYDEFVAHITHVRTVAADGEIVVHEAVHEGNRVADRHTVTITKRDGSRTSFEVLLIGELADDGRLLRVTETTRQLSGDRADANLGRARS